MKLNENIRSAFVRAAMNDVPAIDYQQQAIDLALATAISLMPVSVKALYDDPATTNWIKVEYVYLPGSLSGVQVPALKEIGYYLRETAPDAWKQLEELANLKHKQDESRKALENKLKSVAKSVTTYKALAELLPEFKKYLPDETSPALTQLPACANLVSDFIQAGWPKGEKPCTA